MGVIKLSCVQVLTMFGLIVSGRLVSTKWEQASPTNFIAEIPEADSVNHVVVFLSGQVPFPEGIGGAVYFSWPQSEGGQSWQLLGTISNSKPSAIFRVAKLKGSSQDDNKENITNSFMELGHPPIKCDSGNLCGTTRGHRRSNSSCTN